MQPRRVCHTYDGTVDLGCVATVDGGGQTTFTADPHREGRRFVVPADQRLSAFVVIEISDAILTRLVQMVAMSDSLIGWSG
jgi:hypothetical protein